MFIQFKKNNIPRCRICLFDWKKCAFKRYNKVKKGRRKINQAKNCNLSIKKIAIHSGKAKPRLKRSNKSVQFLYLPLQPFKISQWSNDMKSSKLSLNKEVVIFLNLAKGKQPIFCVVWNSNLVPSLLILDHCSALQSREMIVKNDNLMLASSSSYCFLDWFLAEPFVVRLSNCRKSWWNSASWACI